MLCPCISDACVTQYAKISTTLPSLISFWTDVGLCFIASCHLFVDAFVCVCDVCSHLAQLFITFQIKKQLLKASELKYRHRPQLSPRPPSLHLAPPMVAPPNLAPPMESLPLVDLPTLAPPSVAQYSVAPPIEVRRRTRQLMIAPPILAPPIQLGHVTRGCPYFWVNVANTPPTMTKQ